MDSTYSPRRDIVVASVESIKTELKRRIAETAGEFVLDLGGVEMVDSKGIGLLISTFATLSEKQRGFKVVGTPPDILQLFRSMRMNQHFVIE
jgi:anti-anti-sigma factor